MLSLETLHADHCSLNVLLVTKFKDLAHGFCVGHLHESKAAWTAPSVALWISMLAHSGMGGKHTHHGPVRREMALQSPCGLEAQLVDPAHDEEAVWIFVGKELQTRGQRLHLSCPKRLLQFIALQRILALNADRRITALLATLLASLLAVLLTPGLSALLTTSPRSCLGSFPTDGGISGRRSAVRLQALLKWELTAIEQAKLLQLSQKGLLLVGKLYPVVLCRLPHVGTKTELVDNLRRHTSREQLS
mmetsp:Transcript_154317/g.287755  ORF Transcript_154317/g.287755 Transcript_154317/m.287755 type:complete len:247 (+) Transcript_154317:347-1087(+)